MFLTCHAGCIEWQHWDQKIKCFDWVWFVLCCGTFASKGVMNWEIKTPLIFWYKSDCTIKHPVNFRTQNFCVSQKTSYIEANLPKRQLVECTTLPVITDSLICTEYYVSIYEGCKLSNMHNCKKMWCVHITMAWGKIIFQKSYERSNFRSAQIENRKRT